MFVLSSATVMLPEGGSSCRLRFVWKLLTIQIPLKFGAGCRLETWVINDRFMNLAIWKCLIKFCRVWKCLYGILILMQYLIWFIFNDYFVDRCSISQLQGVDSPLFLVMSYCLLQSVFVGRIGKQFRLMDWRCPSVCLSTFWLTFAYKFWNLLCNPAISSSVVSCFHSFATIFFLVLVPKDCGRRIVATIVILSCALSAQSASRAVVHRVTHCFDWRCLEWH